MLNILKNPFSFLCLVATVTFFNNFGHALELRLGYEPFLLTQFNEEQILSYQGGTLAGIQSNQGKRNLVMNLVSIGISHYRNLPLVEFKGGFHAGISFSPYPTRETWNTFGDVGFTGAVRTTDNVGEGDSYWDGHRVGFVPDGVERYLIEDTTLMQFPFAICLIKEFKLNQKISISGGLEAGISALFIATRRQRLLGTNTNTNSYYKFDRQTLHISENLGMSLSFLWAFMQNTSIVAQTSVNGVSRLSNTQLYAGADGIEGYRFDGLRYNAKIGVAWKI